MAHYTHELHCLVFCPGIAAFKAASMRRKLVDVFSRCALKCTVTAHKDNNETREQKRNRHCKQACIPRNNHTPSHNKLTNETMARCSRSARGAEGNVQSMRVVEVELFKVHGSNCRNADLIEELDGRNKR